MLIQKTLKKPYPGLNKGLFHSLAMPLLALLGLFTDQNDRFPYPFIYLTEAAECCETWGGVGGGGIMFHSAIRIPLLKFSNMPLALIVGTSNHVDPPAPTPPPVLQLIKSLPFLA